STLAGQFVSESWGAGSQQLAFGTNDGCATAGSMASNGFTPLPISPNYYDDVEARFGLAPDFVSALRQYQILYDEDDKGSYLQLYSPLIGGAFFFEVVERRRYQGYGAPNAIFRIAAQHQFIRLADVPG